MSNYANDGENRPETWSRGDYSLNRAERAESLPSFRATPKPAAIQGEREVPIAESTAALNPEITTLCNAVENLLATVPLKRRGWRWRRVQDCLARVRAGSP
jgi:hypothetical protein